MRKISIKAIFVGGLVDVASSFVLAILITLISASHRTNAPKTASDYSIEIALGLICSAFGGYITGKLAKENQALNGALSSWLCTLLGICAVASGMDHQPHSIQIFNFIAAPVFALAGGYLARPREDRQHA